MKNTQKHYKYDAITYYLIKNKGIQVILTFTQFDELLFSYSGLPETAKNVESWWTNDQLYAKNGAYGWLNAGYHVIQVDLINKFVVFQQIIN